MKHGKICTVCGRSYEYCNNCSDYSSQPRWKFLFDSENCSEVFDTVSKFNQGIISAREARNILDRLDLKRAEPLKGGIKESVKKIYAFEKKQDKDSDKE